MKKKTIQSRALSLLLSLVMIFTMLPIAALAANGSTVYGEPETIRLSNDSLIRENNFNFGWKFYLGNNKNAMEQNFNDSGWDSVTLPHDFSISQPFTTEGEAESGFLPGGTGWYRKSFTLPAEAEGKTAVLNFDGVYSQADVYVNGREVGNHHYGYSPFAVDITKELVCDGVTENVIAVRAVNEVPTSRWYSGSGIYRDVTLFVMDPVHVAHYGTRVTTPDIERGRGTVQVEVEVVNDGSSAADVTVTNTVVETGDSAEASVHVNGGRTGTVTCAPEVANPSLWSVDSPNLYTIRTELSVNGSVVDTYETRFGFRYFDFNSRGFSLNGENVKLNGVCMHHDQGALGSAACTDAIRRQLSILKDMGVNAIRTSHNPADEDFIRTCDELGLLVIEETFDGLNEAKNDNRNDFSLYFEGSVDTRFLNTKSGMTNAEFAARSMFRRDRNAPSVILWSFGNEIQEGTHWNTVGQFPGFAASYCTWAEEEDGTRRVTIGDNNRGGDSRIVSVLNTILEHNGIVGFNYARTAGDLSSLASRFGGSTGCILASETASATNSSGRYMSQANNSGCDGAMHLTSYDTSTVGWGLTAHDSLYNTYQNDNVAGEFVWTGFDYIGEPTPYNGTGRGQAPGGRGATPNSSYFGIIDTTGFPKDTFYLYRSQWNKHADTLHLVTAWDPDNMITDRNNKTPVWVYSNAPVVKLYRDDTLVGTATRQDHTSGAGHTYYTYDTQSNNRKICTTSTGSGSQGLYAVFNVEYQPGSVLSARACDSSGRELDMSTYQGRSTVSACDRADHLEIKRSEAAIDADGSSLVYISVNVLDSRGNVDTTASNNIRFTLSGDGEIMGVDNGDQATTNKYQQPSVLKSSTSANINAYAGRALCVVRSTKDAGAFTVDVSSGNLTGGTVTVTTEAVQQPSASGLTSYTMVRDYTVKAGTAPELLTSATGTDAGGAEHSGTIAWDPVTSEIYGTAGDYNLSGTLTFDGWDAIPVTAKLHVIGTVAAMQNIAAATTEGVVPALPRTISGLTPDGTVSGSYEVAWDPMSSEQFRTIGDVVTVNGTAAILAGETLPVTASIRVAQETAAESTNVAPMASTLVQDIGQNYQSDNLASIRNGNRKPGDKVSERWSNWNNRSRSPEASLTFRWDTAQSLSGVNIYYYYDSCAAKPQNVEFLHSGNGDAFEQVTCTEQSVETYSMGELVSYTFDHPVNPVALQVHLTQQSGTTGRNCVAITELEIMTYAAELEYLSSADLSAITVDGTALADFDPSITDYTADGTTVAAAAAQNAGITVLPAQNNVVRIVTVSEDGTATRTYTVTLTGSVTPDPEPPTECRHEHTEIRDQKDATCAEEGYSGDTWCLDCGTMIQKGETIPKTRHLHTEQRNGKMATCTEEGYSGDTWCLDCNTMIEQGQVVPATGHRRTVQRNIVAPTCTEEGYSGDTWCLDCNTMIREGTVLPATGHTWNEGVVTREPTATEEGVRTFTCQNCGTTRTEAIPATGGAAAPAVTLTAERNGRNTIAITGKVEDYANLGSYYKVTGHGFVYLSEFRLRGRNLTVDTSGRSRVNVRDFREDGTYSYDMKTYFSGSTYVVRSFLIYENAVGESIYVYSDPMTVSYRSLG